MIISDSQNISILNKDLGLCPKDRELCMVTKKDIIVPQVYESAAKMKKTLGFNKIPDQNFLPHTTKIGIDDTNLPLNLVFPHKFKHWQPYELRLKTQKASVKAKQLLEKAKKAIKKELYKQWFAELKSVGISAGASTPKWIIDQVFKKIEELTKK